MAHRALVFYEQPAGHYAVHYSHWGAAAFQLQTAITDRTPYGGCPKATHRAWLATVRRLLDRVSFDDRLSTDTSTSLVDPDPIDTTPSLSDYIDQLDFHQYEACYVVSTAYSVSAFLPVWFGLIIEGYDSDMYPAIGNGALIDLDPATEAEWLRGWVDGMKATLSHLVSSDRIGPRSVPAVFAAVVRDGVAGDRTCYIAVGSADDPDSDSG